MIHVPSRDTLYQLYVTERLPAPVIIKRLGMSKTHFYRALRLYGIERHGKTNPNAPTVEDLHRLYVAENLSAETIGAAYGMSADLILYYLKRYDIPRDRVQRNSRVPDKALLERLYVHENLTVEQVAEQIGYSRARTFYLLRKFGIEPNKRITTLNVDPPKRFTPPERPYPSPPPMFPFDRDWLVARYRDDNLNTPQIAIELGTYLSRVQAAMKHHDIPRKPMHLAFRDKPKRFGDFSLGLRRRIRERDHGCCQQCGSPQEPLECHHIIPSRFGGRNSVDNGILLCTVCHDAVGFHELNHAEELLALRGTKTGQNVSA